MSQRMAVYRSLIFVFLSLMIAVLSFSRLEDKFKFSSVKHLDAAPAGYAEDGNLIIGSCYNGTEFPFVALFPVNQCILFDFGSQYYYWVYDIVNENITSKWNFTSMTDCLKSLADINDYGGQDSVTYANGTNIGPDCSFGDYYYSYFPLNSSDVVSRFLDEQQGTGVTASVNYESGSNCSDGDEMGMMLFMTDNCFYDKDHLFVEAGSNPQKMISVNSSGGNSYFYCTHSVPTQ